MLLIFISCAPSFEKNLVAPARELSITETPFLNSEGKTYEEVATFSLFFLPKKEHEDIIRNKAKNFILSYKRHYTERPPEYGILPIDCILPSLFLEENKREQTYKDWLQSFALYSRKTIQEKNAYTQEILRKLDKKQDLISLATELSLHMDSCSSKRLILQKRLNKEHLKQEENQQEIARLAQEQRNAFDRLFATYACWKKTPHSYNCKENGLLSQEEFRNLSRRDKRKVIFLENCNDLSLESAWSPLFSDIEKEQQQCLSKFDETLEYYQGQIEALNDETTDKLRSLIQATKQEFLEIGPLILSIVEPNFSDEKDELTFSTFENLFLDGPASITHHDNGEVSLNELCFMNPELKEQLQSNIKNRTLCYKKAEFLTQKMYSHLGTEIFEFSFPEKRPLDLNEEEKTGRFYTFYLEKKVMPYGIRYAGTFYLLDPKTEKMLQGMVKITVDEKID